MNENVTHSDVHMIKRHEQTLELIFKNFELPQTIVEFIKNQVLYQSIKRSNPMILLRKDIFHILLSIQELHGQTVKVPESDSQQSPMTSSEQQLKYRAATHLCSLLQSVQYSLDFFLEFEILQRSKSINSNWKINPSLETTSLPQKHNIDHHQVPLFLRSHQFDKFSTKFEKQILSLQSQYAFYISCCLTVYTCTKWSYYLILDHFEDQLNCAELKRHLIQLHNDERKRLQKVSSLFQNTVILPLTNQYEVISSKQKYIELENQISHITARKHHTSILQNPTNAVIPKNTTSNINSQNMENNLPPKSINNQKKFKHGLMLNMTHFMRNKIFNVINVFILSYFLKKGSEIGPLVAKQIHDYTLQNIIDSSAESLQKNPENQQLPKNINQLLNQIMKFLLRPIDSSTNTQLSHFSIQNQLLSTLSNFLFNRQNMEQKIKKPHSKTNELEESIVLFSGFISGSLIGVSLTTFPLLLSDLLNKSLGESLDSAVQRKRQVQGVIEKMKTMFQEFLFNFLIHLRRNVILSFKEGSLSKQSIWLMFGTMIGITFNYSTRHLITLMLWKLSGTLTEKNKSKPTMDLGIGIPLPISMILPTVLPMLKKLGNRLLFSYTDATWISICTFLSWVFLEKCAKPLARKPFHFENLIPQSSNLNSSLYLNPNITKSEVLEKESKTFQEVNPQNNDNKTLKSVPKVEDIKSSKTNISTNSLSEISHKEDEYKLVSQEEAIHFYKKLLDNPTIKIVGLLSKQMIDSNNVNVGSKF